MQPGLPRDFDELVRRHRSVIERVAPHAVLEIAHHLWYRGTLERYKSPSILTRAEVLEYLGLPLSTWLIAARQRPQVLPSPRAGTHLSKSSTYDLHAVRVVFEERHQRFPRTSRLGFFPSRLPHFDQFLENEASKIRDELSEGYIFDVPTHLPQTDAELHECYRLVVARVVRFRLKFGMDVEDAINEIWLKLIHSNVLVKFMRSGPKRLPAQLTTDEVLDFLGVEWPQWQRMLKVYPQAPNPVKGDAQTSEALYRSEDIRALDDSGYFKKRGPRYLPSSCVSKALLDRYVARSAEHSLKNVFRTLDRHFNREDTLQDGACIQDNRRVRMSRREDNDLAWEETLSSDAISVESLVDIKQRYEQQQLA